MTLWHFYDCEVSLLYRNTLIAEYNNYKFNCSAHVYAILTRFFPIYSNLCLLELALQS